jgi:LemA protein
MAPWLGLSAAGTTAVFLYFTSIYNLIILNENRIEQVEGNLQALLKKRFSLLPQLVACVQRYMQFEADTLECLTALRQQASGFLPEGSKHSTQKALQQGLQADEALNQWLGQLKLQVEAYPQLQAEPQFTQLMQQLVSIEEKLAVGRGCYNEAVREYNDTIEVFPNFMVAAVCDFKAKPMYVAELQAQQEPCCFSKKTSSTPAKQRRARF